SLRHRDERDRGGIAPRLGACGRDLVANLGKRLGAVRFSDRFHHTRSYHPFASLRSLAAAWVLAQSGELKPGNAVTAIYARPDMGGVDSTYAWIRLFVALVLGTVGSVGMWSYVVALPPVQADFGVLRADASLPYTLGMIG